MHNLLAVLLVFACACGGKYGGGPVTPKDAPKPPPGGIEAAALPYEILERKGTQVEEAAFWDRVAKARAVCVGEEHPNPHHHWMQLHVVREVAKRIGGDKLGLGLEMIQRPFQGPLDDYAAKRIDGAALKSRTGWAERWGYDFEFYGPILDVAVAHKGSLLALNAQKELVKKVVRQGLESLTADEKTQVPELDLNDAAHRAWFNSLMEGLGGAGGHSTKKDGESEEAPNPHAGGANMPSAERIYTAQVLWDETMADGSVKWLKSNPNGHLVILAGNGHCHDSAIINRIKRRGITDVISIRVVIDDDEGSVGQVLAKPMNDYVVVLKFPRKTKTASR
jgi:uncharacterized iron-regulated protein